MKFHLIFIPLFLFILISPPLAASAADSTEGKIEEEIRSIKKEVQELKREIELLKAKSGTVRKAPAPEAQEVLVSMDDDPVKGDDDAPVTIIEFSDYQCPYCGRFFKMTLPEIEKEYIKTGKVKYIFRDFPLVFHKQAPKAAEAANCAGEQGKYWEMHDKLFENQRAIMIEDLKQYAAAMGLDSGSFDTCLDSGKYASETENDLADGQKAGVSGTPSFFIGRTQENKKEIMGAKIVGARPFPSFKQIIDQLLDE